MHPFIVEHVDPRLVSGQMNERISLIERTDEKDENKYKYSSLITRREGLVNQLDVVERNEIRAMYEKIKVVWI